MYNELGERIYPPTKPNETIQERPHDADNWLQCNKPNKGCGRVYTKYESRVEDKLGQFTQTIDNPHDIGHNIIGIGNKKKKTDIQKQHDRLLKQIDAEKDPDIKRELRKGNTVEIIQSL